MWQNWINAVLGIVLLIIAFVGLTGVALAWTIGILGLVIAILGFWGVASPTANVNRL